jgi:hypothetical protein
MIGTRLRIAAPLLVALVSACSAREPEDGGGDAGLSGSYRVSICRSSCADSLLVRGHLVLIASADTPGARGGSGCFSLERMRGDVDTYAGLQPSGQLRWETGPSDPLRLELYRSPDASYEVELRSAGGGLRGTGQSAGFGHAERAAPTDSVIAERIGPPDGRLCAPPTSAQPSGQ